MLCTVNTEVGGVGNDQKSRHFNLMSSIVAIATAPSGNTPVNNPVNSSGVRNTNFNCITTLANSEGGGWSTGTSNSYGPAATFSGSAAAASLFLDLFRPSGKSTYPWYRVSMCPYVYPFNSSFTSYPYIDFAAGATTSNPASVAILSSEAGYYQAYTSASATGITAAYDYATYSTPTFAERMRFDESGKTWTVACTQNYLIIANDQYLWYWGIRSVGSWELARTDNPPWVHFAYGRRQYYGIQNSSSHQERVSMWAATIRGNTTQDNPWLYGQYQNGTGTCALTGQSENGYTPFANHIPGSVWPGGTYRPVRLPLFNSALQSNYGPYTDGSYTYVFPIEGPIADSVTGLNVPPVYPVVFHAFYHESGVYSAASGVAPGIYKGMCTTNAGLNSFVTAASYTIAGDTYVPVRTGNANFPDLWMFRSA